MTDERIDRLKTPTFFVKKFPPNLQEGDMASYRPPVRSKTIFPVLSNGPIVMTILYLGKTDEVDSDTGKELHIVHFDEAIHYAIESSTGGHLTIKSTMEDFCDPDSD